MPTKKWDVTVSHAQTCELDKKLYLYHSSESQQKKAVVFNIVGKVMGFFINNKLIFNEKLSASDEADAHDLVLTGFQNWEKVNSFNDEASLMSALHCSPTIDYPTNTPVVADFDGNNSSTANAYGNGDNPELSFNVDYSSNPPVAVNSYGYNTLTANPHCNGDYPELSSFSTAQTDGLFSADDYFSPNDLGLGIEQLFSNFESEFYSIPQFSVEDQYLQNYISHCHLKNSVLTSSTEQQNAVGGVPKHPVTSDSGHKRWKMVFSAVRWISIRRILAIKSCFADKRQIVQ